MLALLAAVVSGTVWLIRRISGTGPDTDRPNAVRRLRIAVVAYEHQLGSMVAANPVFAALRQLQPDAEIVVFGTALLSQALRFDPSVDRVVATADPHDRPVRALRDIIAAQAGAGAAEFDWLFTTAGCRRGLVGLLVAAIPARQRAGHAVASFAARYEHPAAYDERTSMYANNLRILAPLGGGSEDREPLIHFDATVMREVRTLLAAHGVDPDRPLAALAFETSGGQPTQWFPDRAAAVADRLVRQLGMQVVLVGTAAGQATIEAVRGHMSAESASLAGQTGVAALAALFAMADLAVTLDTGAMHVARAAGVPLIVVASAWQPAALWLPIRVPQARVVSRHDQPGLCCGDRACVTRACMRSITADEVFAEIQALLRLYPPSAAARGERCAARIAGLQAN